MLVDDNFRLRLRGGDCLIGTLSALPCAQVIELLADVGFDWLFLDAEHGAYGPESIIALLQAAGTCPCLVRIPGIQEDWIKKVLDAGASGLIVPQIKSVQDAKRVVELSKYPPVGKRGVGLGRAHHYGRRFSEYLASANESTTLVLQAETQQAIDHIDAIAAIPEVDAVLIGPYDLSASLGYIGQIDHPIVVDAIETVRTACMKHHTRLGIFGVSADHVRGYMQNRFTLITVGVDSIFLNTGATETLAALKPSDQ